jgi:DNA-binding NtrC family response regulator
VVVRHRFRADLLYRLDVIRLNIPPLRERPEDIIPLAQRFLALAAHSCQREVPVLSRNAETRLLEHGWPGNVRELSNCILESVLQSSHRNLDVADLRLHLPTDPEADLGVVLSRLSAGDSTDMYRRTERLLLQWALARCAGNRTRAASLLGIGRGTLREKVRRHHLEGAAQD